MNDGINLWVMSKIQLSPEEKSSLEVRHEAARDSRESDRIKAVLLCSEGWSVTRIAHVLRKHETDILRHLNEYQDEQKLQLSSGGSSNNLSGEQPHEPIAVKSYLDYLQPKHLRKLEIFSPLTETVLRQLLDAPENGIEDYAPRKDIIQESEIGECMYIILEGSVEVYLRGELGKTDSIVANLHAGEYFGENVMVSEKPVKRTASVRAYLPTLVFRLDKQRVLEAIKGHTKISGRFPPDGVRDMIMSLPMFNSLNYEELLTIRDWTQVVTYKQNEFVFKASNPAEYMYVVLEGNIELLTLGSDGTIIVDSEYKKGGYFGEIGLMPDGKGKYGIYARASKKSRVIKIPKEYFRLMLSRDSELADKLNTSYQIKKLRIKELQNQ